MIIIGLTGGIASGKSTVTRTLRQLGAVILSADEIYHATIEPGQPAWNDIVHFFGREVLNEDETINRARLGSMVFNDQDRMQQLNRITHPRIMERIRAELEQMRNTQPGAVVVMEIPLLYETHMDKLCDQVWVVWVNAETQLQRLMQREHISREDAATRIRAQMPLDEKAARADRVIDNNGSVEETIAITTRYFNDILSQKSVLM